MAWCGWMLAAKPEGPSSVRGTLMDEGKTIDSCNLYLILHTCAMACRHTCVCSCVCICAHIHTLTHTSNTQKENKI